MEKNTPEKKFRAGAICATVWKNQAKNPNPTNGDGTYFSISVDRNYKDKDGKWQSISSFRVSDLPKVSLVTQKAFEYLVLKDTGSSAAEAGDSHDEDNIY